MYVYVCIYKHLDNMCVILMFFSAYEYCLRNSFGSHKPNQVFIPSSLDKLLIVFRWMLNELL